MGSGYSTKGDLSDLAAGLSKEQAEDLWSDIHKDGWFSGKELSRPEATKMMKQMALNMTEKLLAEQHKLDKMNEDKMEDIKVLLKSNLTKQWKVRDARWGDDDAAVEGLMDNFDINKDGKVTKDEFIQRVTEGYDASTTKNVHPESEESKQVRVEIRLEFEAKAAKYNLDLDEPKETLEELKAQKIELRKKMVESRRWEDIKGLLETAKAKKRGAEAKDDVESSEPDAKKAKVDEIAGLEARVAAFTQNKSEAVAK